VPVAGIAGTARGRRSHSWPLRRIAAAIAAAAALFSALALVTGALALADLTSARARVVGQLDPAAVAALQLDAALVDQETGVRGYALSAQKSFLVPYTGGVGEQNAAVGKLRRLLRDEVTESAVLAEVVERAEAWRARYALPLIQRVRAAGKPVVSPDIGRGKSAFDMLRRSVALLQSDIARARTRGITQLRRAATAVAVTGAIIAAALILTVAAFTVGLRRAVIRPLSGLAAEVRRVAAGDFTHQVGQSGPGELSDLGADVNRMRERILQELSALRAAHADLEARSGELQRSNSELEQFAYVASHDLQEPLRKVASFCELLQRRYRGQLDERADQYIDFAVDGAKRMQVLVNDLLTFSRVGRAAQDRAPVSTAAALEHAKANLSPEIEASGAVIEVVTPLPVVQGKESLLATVFQNLLSNSLKFRGLKPLRISISARRDGDYWLFSVADNGIGVEPEFAERIFVIFQRLHSRNTYPGTGIGLALCRKIIEYHGGRIWLDLPTGEGAVFCFTLPGAPQTGEKNE
jgi:signal transduction histidine kinase